MLADGASQGGRVPLVVPDLAIDEFVRVSLWLVPQGASVQVGDRVVELLVSTATIDLEAPIAGRIVRQCVDEDEIVGPGVLLAEIEPPEGA
jgi:pyruvate/2-oxoglutarate dehydrogenase complex dihydrolipoamide acyltransferase (E2) component